MAVSLRLAVLSALILARASVAFTIDQPSADRWIYPFNTAPGARPAASVFGAVGEAGFDDRDGQFLVRFDTAAVVPSGMGAANYQLEALTLALTVNVGLSFLYDPTYDSYRTHLAPAAAGFLADADAGRPIELFAVGYRGGYSRATFAENSPFATGSAMIEGARNAYAAGFDAGGALVDVSNNVAGEFEIAPFAIGQIEGLAPGSLVPQDSAVRFDLDLANSEVMSWLRASLDAGYLEFMVTSLAPTSQQAASGFPSFYTKENALHDPASGDFLAGRLAGSVTVVPEPRALGLLALGGLMLLLRRRCHA